MKIANRQIGPGHPVYIIAEAGLAHLGSLDLAMEMLYSAKEAGADAFKTQFWDINNSSSLYSGARKSSRCLGLDHIVRLSDMCKKLDIHFLCTPHDEYALGVVARECPAIKIGSGERENFEFIRAARKRKLPMIISLGNYTQEDRIKLAKALWPAAPLYASLYNFPNIAFLFCVSKYPTTWEDVKGKMPDFRSSIYGGWSSHTGINWGIDKSAVAAGAKIIEKHIKPNLLEDIETSMDMKASLPVEQFSGWCHEIQAVDDLFS